MANIIAPGVTVNITNESFYAPNAAGSIPLFFVATRERKTTTPTSGIAAPGTYESNVIRTVTSLKQSTDLYGIPYFHTDINGNPLHGDARNEYGLFALNQYLSLGNLAYVIRANINTNDSIDDIRSLWKGQMTDAAANLEYLVQNYIDQYNASHGYSVVTPAFQGYQIVEYSIALTSDTAIGNLTDGLQYTADIYVDSETIGIDGITWSGGVGTVYTLAPHNLSIGDWVSISGLVSGSPSTYEEILQVTGVGSTQQGSPYFTVDMAADPLWVGPGNVVNGLYPISYTASENFVSTATWAAGRATYVTTTNHDLIDGDRVSISGVTGGSPGEYDGVFTVTVISPTSFSVSMPTNPGYAGSGGSPIQVGVVSATMGNVITQLNLQLLGAATAAIVGGNIKITSVTSGTSSTVNIIEPVVRPLFTSLDFWAANAAPVNGTGTGSLYKTRVSKTELLSLVSTATSDVWEVSSFTDPMKSYFMNDHRTELAVPSTLDWALYVTGYDQPATGKGLGTGDTHFGSGFYGFIGEAEHWVAYGMGSGNHDEQQQWTAAEAKTFLLAIADDLAYTFEFYTETSLGINDDERRAAIVTALQASINSNQDIRSEYLEYNMIVCPGYWEVSDELLKLCEDIQEEAFVLVDTPFNLNPQDVVTWGATTARSSHANGLLEYSYPHGIASNLDGQNVFCASSGIELRTMGYSDSISEVWFAPAGLTRGVVTGVTDIGYLTGTLGTATTFVPVALNRSQQGNLYTTANINPIVFFPGKGIIVWGQKTSATGTTALDRIAVVRMMMHIKRQLRKATLPFVFEPNDQLTRDNVKAVCDQFLGDIMTRRGLYDFAVQCDASNNTGYTIDNYELIVDIAVKPTKAAEFITINIRVVSTSATI